MSVSAPETSTHVIAPLTALDVVMLVERLGEVISLASTLAEFGLTETERATLRGARLTLNTVKGKLQ